MKTKHNIVIKKMSLYIYNKEKQNIYHIIMTTTTQCVGKKQKCILLRRHQ